ncbi:MAG TPA: hypothetical protein DD379_23910 [Cyanobacteria bacterium UBA11162]|nr:hypothetical protein [Cyanobacteria bacterium UBA11162]
MVDGLILLLTISLYYFIVIVLFFGSLIFSLTIDKIDITLGFYRNYLEINKKTENWALGQMYDQMRIDITRIETVFLTYKWQTNTCTAKIYTTEGDIYPLLSGLSENEGAWLVAEIEDWLKYK